MLKSRKHVFWEALAVTVVVFLMGLLIGIMIETGNSNKISNFYVRSEIDFADGLAISQLSEDVRIACDEVGKVNIDLANRVYEEAALLEDYEEAGILTDNLKLMHQRYDLLRTLIWIGNQRSLNVCDNYDLVVYLYEYDVQDSDKEATQDVWSSLLLDLKDEREDLLLLPIAADQDLASLDLLIKGYGIEKIPAVVVNNKKILYTLDDVNNIRDFLR